MGIDSGEPGGWWRGRAPDAVLALALLGLLLVNTLVVSKEAGDPAALDYAVLLGATLTLTARRVAPVAVLLAVTACAFAYFARVDRDPVAAIPVWVALSTAVEAGRRAVAGAAAAAFFAGSLAVNLLSPDDGHTTSDALQDTLLPFGWFVAAMVMGEVARQRQAYLHQVEQRAAEAERTREEAALRRAGEERLRIARELHDSLTHSISIIKVQAGVAIHLARKRGEPVPDALLAIEDASKDAVRELRATLDVLRAPADASSGSGLDRLPDLVERARSAGLPVTVTVEGRRRTLPSGVDRAAYRIVQEALTNVSRHAGPATATVRVGYGPGELTVRVDDDGKASAEAPPVPGVGLIGMRERVTALGGRLTAEPRPEGGFTVEAVLAAEDGRDLEGEGSTA